MELEKIFSDLESNQVQEWEEAKQKLVELFSQHKEQWVVQYMMEYFLKTGSLRIMEVLVKVQPPHDTYIFDRLDDWLKSHNHRLQALNLFCFVVRKHPTWLFKVEKHRLIKDIIKLLLNEKEIVPLMSALLCIITLLPIIPSLVPNFLNDLFEVFGHLAAWNVQNQNRLSEDKLVHLQLGLQMLFHRLYGMFPCNFLAYLSDFIKKERGAIFQHTIQPLLETVRVHPMLVTATLESEISSTRWKEMEPHDVVMDCARVTLPVIYQDLNAEHSQCLSSARSTPGITYSRSNSNNAGTPSIIATNEHFTYELKQVFQQNAPIARFEGGAGDLARVNALWSPYNEITASGPIPLTPTPSYRLPINVTPNQLLEQAGSSPPEAAVEATPETTPMKVGRELKQSDGSSAVRAIFAATSQVAAASLRRDIGGGNKFNPDVTELTGGLTMVEKETSTRVVTRYTTTTLHHDRRMQQVIQDRTQSQSPFQTIDALNAKRDYRSSLTPGSVEFVDVSPTPLMQPQGLTPTSTTQSTPILTPASSTPVEHITKVCDNCSETEGSLCSAGGLHTPTSRSIELLAKGIKRRNRMVSYCYNDKLCGDKTCPDSKRRNTDDIDGNKVRRTQSCSALKTDVENSIDEEDQILFKRNDKFLQKELQIAAETGLQRRLQKSNKMLSIPKVSRSILADESGRTHSVHVETQTVQIEPQNYESVLFTILRQTDEKREEFERQRCLRHPQEIFNRYISSCWVRDSFDGLAGYRVDQEQYQLLCLQLQYERYRREIHAERNRRLMGRSRDRRSLEMERDRLCEQFKNIAAKDKELMQQIDHIICEANEKEQTYMNELSALKLKYQNEIDQNKCLRQANENLQKRLTDEISSRQEMNTELEALRGQVFSITAELQNAQQQAEIGLLCKQELARLEAEFIVMGEVQIKCRDRLLELENHNARSDEIQMLQDTYNLELKELKHNLDERTAQLDGAKHKIIELQTQFNNSEKVITEQKRLLRAVKDEYEEKFKAVNRKYDIQKTIIMKMEEKLVMSLSKPQAAIVPQPCSPDTDKTDVASSMERNSPLSTSLASSESLSASLRSTTAELRNLQQLVEPCIPEASGPSLLENTGMPTLDMGTSATAAAAINIIPNNGVGVNAQANDGYDIVTAGNVASTSTHIHPHLHLQQQQKRS